MTLAIGVAFLVNTISFTKIPGHWLNKVIGRGLVIVGVPESIFDTLKIVERLGI